MARLVEARVDSMGLLGNTWVYRYLTRAEKHLAPEATMTEVQGRMSVVAGIIAIKNSLAANAVTARPQAQQRANLPDGFLIGRCGDWGGDRQCRRLAHQCHRRRS